ncbi:MAG: class II aldolase/adducin family protein [Pseudomonadota bacterium]|nr:class II aldolase/adducin family protein [Pseudomonadota bacterium]
MMKFKSEREMIIDAVNRLHKAGLIINTSGNVSIKIGEHIIITPSAAAYKNLIPTDILVMSQDKKVVEGNLLPSSEVDLHYSIYKKYESIKAIVHTHSLYATAVSSITNELPAIHYQIVDLGGIIPVAPYKTFGSCELASVVVENICGKNAVLMQNHGAVTIATNLEKALSRSILLEWLCSLYLISKQSGKPSLIEQPELAAVKNQMKKYQKMREEFI